MGYAHKFRVRYEHTNFVYATSTQISCTYVSGKICKKDERITWGGGDEADHDKILYSLVTKK